MNPTIWSVLGGILAIIIGLWKFFRGKASERRQKAGAAHDEIKQGIQDGDPNRINSGNSELNRMRRK